MAEVQTTTQSGEMTQRFIEFVMMQSQNAALFLGQIPNPQTGQPEVNLEVARMFIDQLAMIREKTRGNLSKDEEQVLTNAISGLQMAFVEASRGESGQAPAGPGEASQVAGPSAAPQTAPEHAPERPRKETPEPAAGPALAADAKDAESKKRFTKSYG